MILSNNYAKKRIYDIGQPNRPEMATAIGPHANQSARWLSTTTFSSCLDDVAVSFDFGLPCERTDARRRDATVSPLRLYSQPNHLHLIVKKSLGKNYNSSLSQAVSY